MDWSLVLASQGLEHVIEHSDQSGWELLVTERDFEAARTAIEQYRRENRLWPWRKQISTTGEIFDGSVVAWVLLTVVFYWLSDTRVRLRNSGMMDGTAVALGEWWRLFTATLLHADLAHLAANALFGFIFIGLAMGRYGTGVGLLAAFIAGVCGNLASWFVRGNTFHGLGASGVVMGALGLVAVQSIAHLRLNPRAMKIIVGGIAGGVMLFTLLGLSPGTDVVAHLGGFLAGIALGFLLAPIKSARSSIANLAAGLLLAALILATWALALRHSG